MSRESFSLDNLPNWMRGRFNDGQRFLLLCICAGLSSGNTPQSSATRL